MTLIQYNNKLTFLCDSYFKRRKFSIEIILLSSLNDFRAVYEVEKMTIQGTHKYLILRCHFGQIKLNLSYLGVGCMKVENLKMVQYCSPEFFIVANVITRHEKNKFLKNMLFSG